MDEWYTLQEHMNTFTYCFLLIPPLQGSNVHIATPMIKSCLHNWIMTRQESNDVGGRHYLCIEFHQKVKMPLEISRKDELNHKEPEAAELGVLQTRQEVVLGLRDEETPWWCSMVVLQDGSVVVKNRLSTYNTYTMTVTGCHGRL